MFVGAEIENDADSQAVVRAAVADGVEIVSLKAGVISQIADASSPRPIIAVAPHRPVELASLEHGRSILVADRIGDPGNLGSIVRVAEACGHAGVIVTEASTDPFGPKALRGSAGSAFRVPIVEAGDLASVITWLRSRGTVVWGTSSHEGEDFAVVTWPPGSALVVGNEAAGLTENELAMCDRVVTIPMAGEVESLNVSVAIGILAMTAARALRADASPAWASTMQPMAEGDVR